MASRPSRTSIPPSCGCRCTKDANQPRRPPPSPPLRQPALGPPPGSALHLQPKGKTAMTAPQNLPHDSALAAATAAAARVWTCAPGMPEADLERALLPTLRRHFDNVDAPTRKSFTVPNWNPYPRGIDLLVRHTNGSPWIPIELKVEATDQTLWDAYKLIALLELPSVECAYLICAARTTTWASGRNCVELFPSESRQAVTLDSHSLFARNRAAWNGLLLGGRARPTSIPAEIVVEPIAATTCALVPGYEIRAVRVTPGGGS